MEKIGYLLLENSVSSQMNIISMKDDLVIFDAVLQDGDIENRNGLIYPTSILEAGFKNPILLEKVATKNWVGEAGHPLEKTMARQLRIERNNVSHYITTLPIKKSNSFISTIESTPTDRGYEMAKMAKRNTKIAFSLRGVSDIIKQGTKKIIKGPLLIYTYDWVDRPSHAVAYQVSNLRNEESGLIRIDFNSNDVKQILNENSDIYNMLHDNFNLDPVNTTIRKVEKSQVVLENSGLVMGMNLEKFSKNLIRELL